MLRIKRANTLNLRSKGLTIAEVADFVEITCRTVINIENRYEEGGLDNALYDDPRPGQPPKIDDRVKSHVVALVCSDPPEGFDRWTVNLIQDKVEEVIGSISHESIIAPGEEKKVDYEYKRKGSCNVFCAVEGLQGEYFNKVTKQRRGVDFTEFLGSIAQHYPNAEKIVLVMDNLNTHKLKSLTDFYGEEEGNRIWNRFEVHYTPKHGSWLNQAEIAINIYSRQCLGKSRIPDIETLTKKTNAWNRYANSKKTTIQWGFTTSKAREKFKYGEKINLTSH